MQLLNKTCHDEKIKIFSTTITYQIRFRKINSISMTRKFYVRKIKIKFYVKI